MLNAWFNRVVLTHALFLMAACGGGGSSTTPTNLAPSSKTSMPHSSIRASSVAVSSFHSAANSNDAHSTQTSFSLPAAASSSGANDFFKPSSPRLFIDRIGQTSVKLSWSSSTDDTGIGGYTIIRTNPDKVRYKITLDSSTFSYDDTNLIPNTLYQYEITAYDLSDNPSITLPARTIHTSGMPEYVDNSSSSSSSSQQEGSSISSYLSSASISSSIQASSYASQSSMSTSSNTTSILDSNGCLTQTGLRIIGWDRPNKRENGDLLNETDIADYEIRYRLKFDIENKNRYTYVNQLGAYVTKIERHFDEGDCDLQMSTVDTNGARSKFFPISVK